LYVPTTIIPIIIRALRMRAIFPAYFLYQDLGLMFINPPTNLPLPSPHLFFFFFAVLGIQHKALSC
jgi:hypothetical protein